MFVHQIPRWFQRAFPGFTWWVGEGGTPARDPQKIYLTFDDGPIPDVTEFVLDELKKFNAPATFFCVGENVQKHPRVFERLLAEGHVAANHTHRHQNGWRTPTPQYLEGVERCGQVLGNMAAPLFRPPYGRIGSAQAKALRAGYELVMWSVLSGDYNRALSPEACLRGTIKATSAGAIVVFHDSQKAERNLRYVLPRFLEHFAEKGIGFSAL